MYINTCIPVVRRENVERKEGRRDGNIALYGMLKHKKTLENGLFKEKSLNDKRKTKTVKA